MVLMPLRPGSRPDPEAGMEVPLQTANQAYLAALQAAGATPILVPLDTGDLDGLEFADGLLLPGGLDINPRAYGAPPHPTCEWDDRLDDLEFRLTRWALERKLPILGICRGLQVLNVVLGGSLVQDLPSQRPQGVTHPRQGPRFSLTHHLTLVSGGRLAAAVGADEVPVNSLHHQGVERLAPGLLPSARAEDGLIEGVEMAGDTWVVAVQFHPEELFATQPYAARLFESFVAACSGRVTTVVPA